MIVTSTTKLLPILLLLATFSALSTSWSIFPLPSRSSLESYAKQKISSLKSLRGILNNQKANEQKNTNPEDLEIISNGILSSSLAPAPSTSASASLFSTINTDVPTSSMTPTSTPPEPEPLAVTLPITAANLTSTFYQKEIEKLEQLTIQSGNLTSKTSVENLIDQLAITTQDINKKLVEMRETIEPKVKKFLTEKYNSLLSNLVPYSETIGVPTYVLNSLKIPQNFDPRLQQLISTIKSFSLVKKKTVKTGDGGGGGGSDDGKIQSRMDEDLVSDQEPDATSKGQKKYVYLAGRNRPKAYVIPDKSGYEIAFDSVSPGDQEEAFESNLYNKGYYLEDYPYASVSDIYETAESNMGRRHHGNSRGGHGHGGGGGYGGQGGGLMDPFTILGGLAFLTYLGLLIQQSLNRTATGREISEWELQTYSKKLPAALTKLQFDSDNHNLSQKSYKSATNAKSANEEEFKQWVSSTSGHEMQPPVTHPKATHPHPHPHQDQQDSDSKTETRCTHFCQVLNKLRRLKQIQQEQTQSLDNSNPK